MHLSEIGNLLLIFYYYDRKFPEAFLSCYSAELLMHQQSQRCLLVMDDEIMVHLCDVSVPFRL